VLADEAGVGGTCSGGEPTPVVCQWRFADRASVVVRSLTKEEVVMATAADIRTLAEPVLHDAGLELWDIQVTRDTVRIYVERAGGVDLDALTRASEAISDLLDEHDDLVPEKGYQLEITSPGLERALRTPDHYRRYVGTTVNIKTTAPVGGARRHKGVLTGVDDGEIQISLDAGIGEPLAIRFDEIDKTTTVVDWAQALKGDPAPGAAADDDGSGEDAAGSAGTARDTKDLAR
jgi:ribosome maturation factor RimP